MEQVEQIFKSRGVRGNLARSLASELDDNLQSFPANLSGGEKQRVATCTMSVGSELLLADHLTGGIDSASGRAAMERLRPVARDRKRAVIETTQSYAYSTMLFIEQQSAIIQPIIR